MYANLRVHHLLASIEKASAEPLSTCTLAALLNYFMRFKRTLLACFTGDLSTII